MRRSRRRRRRLAFSALNLGFVPPLGRVRTWTVRRRPGGCSSTYVVIQVPRNPGNLASRRIEAALRKGFEAGMAEGEPGEGRKGLYLVMTDLVRLFRR
ncbi:MAG: hypothetical protein ACOX5M_00575 [Bacillota bacterium]